MKIFFFNRLTLTALVLCILLRNPICSADGDDDDNDDDDDDSVDTSSNDTTIEASQEPAVDVVLGPVIVGNETVTSDVNQTTVAASTIATTTKQPKPPEEKPDILEFCENEPIDLVCMKGRAVIYSATYAPKNPTKTCHADYSGSCLPEDMTATVQKVCFGKTNCNETLSPPNPCKFGDIFMLHSIRVLYKCEDKTTRHGGGCGGAEIHLDRKRDSIGYIWPGPVSATTPANCSWVIITEPGEAVDLEIINYHLPAPNDSNSESIVKFEINTGYDVTIFRPSPTSHLFNVHRMPYAPRTDIHLVISGMAAEEELQDWVVNSTGLPFLIKYRVFKLNSYFYGCFEESDELDYNFAEYTVGTYSAMDCIAQCEKNVEHSIYAVLSTRNDTDVFTCACRTKFLEKDMAVHLKGECGFCSEDDYDAQLPNLCGQPYTSAVAIYISQKKWPDERVKFVECDNEYSFPYDLPYLENEQREGVDELLKYVPFPVDACIEMCTSHGFMYAGVQETTNLYSQCNCGNSYGRHGKARSMSCGLCPNSHSEIADNHLCGYDGYTAIYQTKSPVWLQNENQKESFRGCWMAYKSRSEFNKDVTDKVAGGMTREKCREACADYYYASLQNGFRCRCSNWYGNRGAADTPCNVPCAGNPEKTCGGLSAIEVYDVVNNPHLFKEESFVGCYADHQHEDKMRLPVKTEEAKNKQECIDTCKNRQQPFAGLDDLGYCYCPMTLHDVSSDRRAFTCGPCPFGDGSTCGSQSALAIYRTSEEVAIPLLPITYKTTTLASTFGDVVGNVAGIDDVKGGVKEAKGIVTVSSISGERDWLVPVAIIIVTLIILLIFLIIICCIKCDCCLHGQDEDSVSDIAMVNAPYMPVKKPLGSVESLDDDKPIKIDLKPGDDVILRTAPVMTSFIEEPERTSGGDTKSISSTESGTSSGSTSSEEPEKPPLEHAEIIIEVTK